MFIAIVNSFWQIFAHFDFHGLFEHHTQIYKKYCQYVNNYSSKLIGHAFLMLIFSQHKKKKKSFFQSISIVPMFVSGNSGFLHFLCQDLMGMYSGLCSAIDKQQALNKCVCFFLTEYKFSIFEFPKP